jgi:hypothetical protein
MEPSDLAFFTSQELIDELMRRKTFLGVVIHSEEDLRNSNWSQEKVFKVRFNENLDALKTSRLLGRVSAFIDQSHD